MKQSNRKNQRTTTARPQRGRVASTEGVYGNHPYMHAATSQVGTTVYVKTISGAVYEGIFRTFSPTFHVALEVAHRVDTPSNGEEPKIAIDTVFNTFIFKLEDIVSICAKNVDLDYATRDTFQTDTAISKCNGSSRSEDRELEPWDPVGSGLTNGDYDLSLQLENDSHGWDANEMFQKNESIYGVQSTFDQSLTGYTVQIDKKNTKDYREKELEAQKIAAEIENNPAYLERVDLENNDELDDEEAKFSAVIRDANSSSPLPQRQERQNQHHHQESRQSEQRSESAQNSNTSRETHNNRDSRGETRENSRQQEVRENHIEKSAQASVSPPTVQPQVNQNQLPPQQQQQVIPQVSAQQERISNQGSQERNREIHHHHQQHQVQQNQHSSGGNSNNNQSMPNQSMHSLAQQNMNTNNTNNVPPAKYVPASKRNMKGGKLVRSTPPPPNNNSASGPPTPQSPQAPQVQNHPQQQGGKQNNYMLQQQQQQPQNMGPAPQYISHGTALYTQHVHNQATAGKLNGQEQNTNQGQNNKMGQRSFPRYPQNANVNVPPPQNVGPQIKNIQQQQIQMGKPIHHVHVAHMPPPTVDGQQATHVVVGPPHQIVIQQPILQAPAGIPNQTQMPQRQPRSRDETTQDFRKFHNNFKLETSSHPQDNRNQQQQQQQQISQNENTQQQIQSQQMPNHQQQQQGKPQREQRQQQQGGPIVNDTNAPHQIQIQNQQAQASSNVQQQQQHQQGPSQNVINSNNSINNNSNANDADKAGGGGSTPGTKKFVLNPAAKPFTPRTPATPSATRPQNSRPHTPQTPSSAIQPAQVMAYAPSHTPGPQIVASPNQPMMTYVVQQQPTFQPPPRQPKRLPVQPSAAQIQVAAATGQPLLAPGPPFVYQAQPQPFPAQTYAFRMPFETSGQPQIQYLTATPPSTTPSPGQAQQFHPGPQPSPASQAATAYMPMQQQGPHFSVPVLTTNGPQIMHTQFYQPTAGPHPQQQYIIMQQPQHPSTQ